MADQNTQDLYSCNGCNEDIPTGRARVACHICPDYQLCANCFVIKQYSGPHVESHSTMVLKLSGFKVPAPPGFAPRAAPPLPPRQNSVISNRQSKNSEVPTANWGALWNIMKAPLEKMDKKSRKGSVGVETKTDEFKNIELHGRSTPVMTGGVGEQEGSNTSSSIAQNPVNNLPPSPPKSVSQFTEHFDTTAPSYPRPAKWEPLFEENGTPKPIFVVLMSTIFGCLDPEHTGYLLPEIYSSFLDIQGYELNSNTWKRTLGGDDSSKDFADCELALYFLDNNISHILNNRTKTPSNPGSPQEPTSAVGKRIRQSISFKPNMPMLSRQGFIDLANIEYHKDLDLAHEHLQRAIRAYGIWEELGDLPRSVFPEQRESKIANFREKSEDEEPKDEEGVKEGKDLYMPPPPLPMRPRGGEAKVEALMKREEFDQGESLITDETPDPATQSQSEIKMNTDTKEDVGSNEKEEKPTDEEKMDASQKGESPTNEKTPATSQKDEPRANEKELAATTKEEQATDEKKTLETVEAATKTEEQPKDEKKMAASVEEADEDDDNKVRSK